MFRIEYQKGWDNAAVDALNWVTSKLDAEIMKSTLDGVTMGMTERADAHNLAVAEADEEIQDQMWETVVLARATHACVNLHVTDWMTAKQEDPILKTTIEWISNKEVQDMKHLLGDETNTSEGKAFLQGQKKLTLYQGALYHHHTPTVKLEEFCSSWSPWLITLLPWMDVTEMLDTRDSSKPQNGHADAEGH